MSTLFARTPCVCVPARDEAERLPRLLRALAVQDWPGVLPVVVAINNTSDRSVEIVDRLARELRSSLAIHVDERTFAPELAHAGSARRRAMDVGVELLGGVSSAVLLSTDADARPPLDWVRRNVEAIERGVDLVGGALALDPDEDVPSRIRSSWDALAAYWRAVRAVEDRFDPVPWDPSPRHGDHTGASLAVTVKAYEASGGVPATPWGEDTAFVMKARSSGYRLSHPVDVWTRVSARLDARASGGMAARMGELARAEAGAMAAPSLDRWRARAQWRRTVRLAGGDAAVAAQEQGLPPMPCDVIVTPVTPEAA